jgi:hypothetical protein
MPNIGHEPSNSIVRWAGFARKRLTWMTRQMTDQLTNLNPGPARRLWLRLPLHRKHGPLLSRRRLAIVSSAPSLAHHLEGMFCKYQYFGYDVPSIEIFFRYE